MSVYRLTALRADGALHPIPARAPGLDAACRQAIRFAQNAAIHGCPLGDVLPPVWVEVRDDAGGLVIRILVDESLLPAAGDGR